MFKLLEYFEINEMKVFVNITISMFNFVNVLCGSSSIHFQQTL